MLRLPHPELAILQPGNPDCVHFEEVVKINKHEIGTCRYCNKTTDYTILHRQLFPEPKYVSAGVTLRNLMEGR